MLSRVSNGSSGGPHRAPPTAAGGAGRWAGNRALMRASPNGPALWLADAWGTGSKVVQGRRPEARQVFAGFEEMRVCNYTARLRAANSGRYECGLGPPPGPMPRPHGSTSSPLTSLSLSGGSTIEWTGLKMCSSATRGQLASTDSATAAKYSTPDSSQLSTAMWGQSWPCSSSCSAL